MDIPSFDWQVVQGNTGTVENPDGIVCHLDPAGGLTASGAQIIFYAHWHHVVQIKKTMAEGGVTLDPATGRIVVPISTDLFREVGPSTHVHYELEYRRGTHQRTILAGSIGVIAGINDD